MHNKENSELSPTDPFINNWNSNCCSEPDIIHQKSILGVRGQKSTNSRIPRNSQEFEDLKNISNQVEKALADQSGIERSPTIRHLDKSLPESVIVALEQRQLAKRR
jgi:hypothetical protein